MKKFFWGYVGFAFTVKSKPHKSENHSPLCLPWWLKYWPPLPRTSTAVETGTTTKNPLSLQPLMPNQMPPRRRHLRRAAENVTLGRGETTVTLIGRLAVITMTAIDPLPRVRGIIISGAGALVLPLHLIETDEEVEAVECTRLLQDGRLHFRLIKDRGEMMDLMEGDGVLGDEGMDTGIVG